MLKLIAWIIFFYLLIRFLRGIFGPMLGMQQRQQNTFMGNRQQNYEQQRQQQYKPGTTHIKHKPENNRQSADDDDGEYIDYKEVKE